MPLDTVILASRVVTRDGIRPAAVGILDGRIVTIADLATQLPAKQQIRLDPTYVLLPGLVDTHVHLQDPGNSEWENFDSGTRAAAAGGVTTLIDMPIDSIPATVDVPSLDAKLASAAGRIHIDVGFWGGLTPDNVEHLGALRDAGVFGFKCFMAETGRDDFPPVSLGFLREQIGRGVLADALVLIHAEDELFADPIATTPAALAPGTSPQGTSALHTSPLEQSYAAYLASRPVTVEEAAVAGIIDILNDAGGRVHIVHVSTGAAATRIAAARHAGLTITAETSPHYLALSAEQITGNDTAAKCCPPIRGTENRDALWSHLARREIEMVVSDHSPSGSAEKNVDFAHAFGGISSLQIALSVMWTQGRQRGHDLCDISNWMATRPAELVGLHRKGAIEVGRDADFCVFAPEESFTVDPSTLHHRQPITAYAGHTLYGVVKQTWLRGSAVKFNDPRGELLRYGAQR